MVGMPLLVMASPLADTSVTTPHVSGSTSAPPVPVSYKNAGGRGFFDNSGDAWFPGGFRNAIISLAKKGGKDVLGVGKDDKSNDILSIGKEDPADAGEWAFKYLTGMDVVREDVNKDTKDWKDWMDKAKTHPVIIMTNGKPMAAGLDANQYYTVFLADTTGFGVISLWQSTPDPYSFRNLFIEAQLGNLKDSTRYLYHLKDWAKY
ncbi:uncharacterized protein L203_104196 [Cryptococcus depauperatus CBS 7841]|uniref:Uncharacterized protein n=1 Tax=Cryptococcus depauperatus CBS 7841 TaxID=1295531 RepID=A0AAJ8M2V0_9TREE